MSNIPEFNEINALEYGTVKTLYELLNKKFRASQRVLDQHSYYLRKDLAAFSEKLHTTDSPVLIKDIEEDINKFNARISMCYGEIDRVSSEQIDACGELLQRSAALCEANMLLARASSSTDETDNALTQRLDLFRRLRLDRFLIEHLLRCGYFDTAEALAKCVGVNMSSVIQTFRAAKEVEETLQRHDLSASLAWVMDNRSKLHRLNSNFETEVRVQQCAELVRSGRRVDAIGYARTYFNNLPLQHWRHGNLLILFGLLGFGINSLPKSNAAAYERLLGAERYDELLQSFRTINARIFRLVSQSAFSACFHTGTVAHNTPYCKEDNESRCIVCSRLYKIAEGLPVAHEPHSKIICSISNEPLNESNLPLMLPNGRVYGEQAVRSLSYKTDGGAVHFRCPFTNQVFNVETIKRVYVL